jgi:hypothetical protein
MPRTIPARKVIVPAKCRESRLRGLFETLMPHLPCQAILLRIAFRQACGSSPNHVQAVPMAALMERGDSSHRRGCVPSSRSHQPRIQRRAGS